MCEWHFWLSAAGVFVMFSDLTLAGIFQGYYWASLQDWEVSVDGSYIFWMVRLVAGLAMFAGLLCFLYNIYRTARGPATVPTQTPIATARSATAQG